MSPAVREVILLIIPLLIGGLIAGMNSNGVNEATERGEAWARQRQKRASAASGWPSRYVLNPLLWAIVTFCDWTDGFEHRGFKNGARVAATLYLLGLWIFILYAAVILVVAVVVIVIIIYFLAAATSKGSDDTETARTRSRPEKDDDEEVRAHVGVRGKKVYSGTNWFNEELKGRVDDEGNLYKGTNWFNEEKIGRIDDEGTIYQGTSWMNEVKVGRIDEDGTLYKGTNWFTEEKTGRIDEDGTIHKGTSWFNEEKQGRTGE